MYTGTAPHLESMAQQLIAAADKYQLDRLKVSLSSSPKCLQVMCEQALCATLTAENACVTLVLADLYNADQLRTHAVTFVNLHATEVRCCLFGSSFLQVMTTEGWADLVKKHPQLLAEAFRVLATQQTPPVVLTQPPKKRLKHAPY